MTATPLNRTYAHTSDLAAGGPAPPEVHIRPVRHRISVRDVTANLGLIRVLVARDLKVKYKQSVLGPIWLLFQPFALLVAFVIGFHSVANVDTGGVSYALFALTGLSMWSYFSSASAAGALSLLGNTNLVRFTSCPRLVLTLANLLASLPSLLVPAVAAVVVALVDGYGSANLILAPLAAMWLVLLTAAFTAITASAAVKWHDIPAALPFLLQVGVFLAPIAYPAENLSGVTRVLLTLNPLTGVIEAWRWCVLAVTPDGLALAASLTLTALLVVGAWLVFGRLEVTMADDI
jgi:lipopolysaccharide transport system permease protein